MSKSLADLRNDPVTRFGRDTAYTTKMFHDVPAFPVVVREAFILERCKGKVVLDVGASGPMHEAIVQVAKKCYGIDRMDKNCVETEREVLVGFDLDDVTLPVLPRFPGVEIVICGEVLEHLSNPGWLLHRLALTYPGVSVVFTVPNAFSSAGHRWATKQIECCNIDHVSYYSWRTLSTLLERYGFKVAEWAWYKGKPIQAEGIIASTGHLAS